MTYGNKLPWLHFGGSAALTGAAEIIGVEFAR